MKKEQNNKNIGFALATLWFTLLAIGLYQLISSTVEELAGEYSISEPIAWIIYIITFSFLFIGTIYLFSLNFDSVVKNGKKNKRK